MQRHVTGAGYFDNCMSSHGCHAHVKSLHGQLGHTRTLSGVNCSILARQKVPECQKASAQSVRDPHCSCMLLQLLEAYDKGIVLKHW